MSTSPMPQAKHLVTMASRARAAVVTVSVNTRTWDFDTTPHGHQRPPGAPPT